MGLIKVPTILCLLIFLVGCSPAFSPAFSPTLNLANSNPTTVDPKFPGLSDFLELASTKGKPLNIILLHGMAYGNPNASREIDLKDDNAQSLYGYNATTQIDAILNGFGITQPAQYLETQGIDRLFVHKYVSEVGQGKRINFYFLNYTGYFAFPDYPNSLGNPYVNYPIKDKVDLIEGDINITKDGANLNVDVKNDLVSWGFADVITYLDIIKRERIIRHINHYLNELYSIHNDGVYVFITESLGGKVLLDSLVKLYSSEEASAHKNDNVNILHSTQAIYMMANQLPLLDLGTELSDSQLMFDKRGNIQVTPNWRTLFTGHGFTKYKPPIELFVVAFSDPSDIFTYSIEPTLNKFNSVTGTHITAIDVLVSLTSPIFGISDPLKAHTGHFENETVIDLLVNGRH